MNYSHRNFARNNQFLYESSIVGRLVSAPKLFHSYIRRKRGCPFIGPLRSEFRRVVSDASDMSELLADAFLLFLLRVLLLFLLSIRVLLVCWIRFIYLLEVSLEY